MGKISGQDGSKRGTGDNDLPPNVAANLRALRRERGLSLETLAQLSGVSRAMLGQIETGKSVPTITLIWKIARALGVQASDLISTKEALRQVLVPRAKIRTVGVGGGGYTLRSFASGELAAPYDFCEVEIAAAHRERFPPRPPGTRATLLVTCGPLEVLLDGGGPAQVLDGDAILFHADVAHSFFNPGNQPAKGYLVIGRIWNGQS